MIKKLIDALTRSGIHEVAGEPETGKTTIALSAVAQMQKNDPSSLCAIVDADHGMTEQNLKNIGVDPARTFFIDTDCAEKTLESALYMCETGQIKALVFDTVSALATASDLDASLDDYSNDQWQIMKHALDVFEKIAKEHCVSVILVNQNRYATDLMGSHHVTTSANSPIKKAARSRVQLIKNLKSDPDGSRIRAHLLQRNKEPLTNPLTLDFALCESGIDIAFDYVADLYRKKVVAYEKGKLLFEGAFYETYQDLYQHITETEAA